MTAYYCWHFNYIWKVFHLTTVLYGFCSFIYCGLTFNDRFLLCSILFYFGFSKQQSYHLYHLFHSLQVSLCLLMGRLVYSSLLLVSINAPSLEQSIKRKKKQTLSLFRCVWLCFKLGNCGSLPLTLCITQLCDRFCFCCL